MIGLAFASLVTWTVYVAKTFELRTARREVRDGLRILAKAATLAQAHEQLRNGTSAGGATHAGRRAGNSPLRQCARRRT